ncbi:phage holin family protein [Granulicoccus phenolivorans]|uniref:phage holin family protein n=1 Tax=Granulicoccus phenolivorans TaxID=266854 RepID=UPI00047E4CDA|nr:phage holin family protein [Granulicoccus phenolivorans]
MNLILRILATAIATGVTAWLLPGIHILGNTTADKALILVVVSLVFGVVNAIVKPLAEMVSFCAIVLTMGLFLLVINALMLLLTAWAASQLGFGFVVDSFWWALAGSVVISLVSGIINSVLGTKKER